MPKRWSKKHAERYFVEAIDIAQEWEEESWHYGHYRTMPDGSWGIEKRFKIRRNKEIREWVERLNMRVEYERRQAAIKILEAIKDGTITTEEIPHYIRVFKSTNRG